MILICFQGKRFYITVIQVYVPTTDAQKAEVDNFYEDLQDLLELTPKRRYPFHQRGLECKSRKPRVTWSNRQVWPWSTKWGRAKTNRTLSREHAGHSKHLSPTTQEMTLSQNQIMFFAAKDGEVVYSQQKQDLELTMVQIISSLLQNSSLSWRKWRKPLGHSSMT